MSNLGAEVIAAAGGAAAGVLLVVGGLWAFAREAVLKWLQARLDRNTSVFQYGLARNAFLADTHARVAFESALEVWTALSDVTHSVDRLWGTVSETNVGAAKDALDRAEKVIGRYTALITDDERKPLQDSMDRMERFLDGKELLMLMRSRGSNGRDEGQVIQRNGQLRENLLAAVAESKRGLERRTRPSLLAELGGTQ